MKVVLNKLISCSVCRSGQDKLEKDFKECKERVQQEL